MKFYYVFIVVFSCLISISQSLSAADVYFLSAYQGGGDFERSTGEHYELDDSFAFSIIVSAELLEDQEFEFTYSHQSTDLIDVSANPNTNLMGVTVDYYHFGSTVLLNEKQGWETFILGTLGFTVFSPSRTASSEILLSMALGLGLRKNLTKNWIFRADTRLYSTYYGSGSTLFCVEGDCDIPVEGDLETQFQLNVGLGYRF